MLVDADEWGQIHLLDLLGRYARKMLRRPSAGNEPTDVCVVALQVSSGYSYLMSWCVRKCRKKRIATRSSTRIWTCYYRMQDLSYAAETQR